MLKGIRNVVVAASTFLTPSPTTADSAPPPTLETLPQPNAAKTVTTASQDIWSLLRTALAKRAQEVETLPQPNAAKTVTTASRGTWSTLCAPIVQRALDEGLLDEREVKYTFVKPEEFPNDLAMLERRWKELADAPPLADAMRFPDRTVVNEMLVFNRAYKNFMEIRCPMDPGQEDLYRTIEREVDRLFRVWDAVRDARCEYYYVTVRRQALKRLREMVGEEAYYIGDLPPHVPLWRFREIP